MKQKRFIVVLVMIVCGFGLAQVASSVTKTGSHQLFGTTSVNGRIWVTLPNGVVRQADVDPATMEIDNSGPRPVVLAKTGVSPQFVVGETPVLDAADANERTYLLAQDAKAGTVIVYRNGLRQKLNDDYVMSGAKTIVFVAHYINLAGDSVLADYQLP